MAVYRSVIFLFLVIVVVVPLAAGKIRGISCTPKNCKWANWERWMECDQLCGGIQLRQRSPNVTESCGGTACEGKAEEARPCNRVCHNGGTLSDGSCLCRKAYRGACCEIHNIFKRAAEAALSPWQIAAIVTGVALIVAGGGGLTAYCCKKKS